jgi:hypothetical protein
MYLLATLPRVGLPKQSTLNKPKRGGRIVYSVSFHVEL